MPLNLTGRHVDITENVRDQVRKRADRFHKFHGRLSLIEVVLAKEKINYVTDILVKAGKDDFRSSETSSDLRASIDAACNKIEKQMEKKKERAIALKRNGSGKVAQAVEAAESAEFVGSSEHPAWLHPEKLEPAKYTVEQAWEKLRETKKRDFFVFRHAQTDNVNVIYKRDDGLVGLVET